LKILIYFSFTVNLDLKEKTERLKAALNGKPPKEAKPKKSRKQRRDKENSKFFVLYYNN
jgi:hypothetical protein